LLNQLLISKLMNILEGIKFRDIVLSLDTMEQYLLMDRYSFFTERLFE
jgi:hypothetical protein